MQLQENSKVYFENISHSYWVGDKELMGVTTLLAKHRLSPDLSNIPKARLDEAARKGTSIHEEIEAYDSGELTLLTPLIKDYKKLHLKHLASEFLVSDNELVASKIDGIYKGKEKNGVIIVDYKSTSDKHLRSWSWQTSIYRVLLERQSPNVVVEGQYVIWIDKNTRRIKEMLPVEPIPTEAVDALFECERKGLIYKDETDEPMSADLVLSQSEVAEYISTIDALAELNEKMKAAQKIVDEANAKVLEYMTSNGIEELEANGGSFKIKKGYERATFDSKTFKVEHPKLAKKYSGTTMVSPSLTFKRKK